MKWLEILVEVYVLIAALHYALFVGNSFIIFMKDILKAKHRVYSGWNAAKEFSVSVIEFFPIAVVWPWTLWYLFTSD